MPFTLCDIAQDVDMTVFQGNYDSALKQKKLNEAHMGEDAHPGILDRTRPRVTPHFDINAIGAYRKPRPAFRIPKVARDLTSNI